MARLLIQFFSDELADFRWASIDESSQTADIAWQQAGEEELATVASQNPHPLIMILPQQCVYLARVEMPQKAGRQLLAAIEYQVEEQLARDIESQHVAIADANANPVSVAVVERALMARCIALAQGHGLRLLHILPELFLCPWPGSGVALMQGHDGYLLRFGDYRGFKCSAETLQGMIELVARDVDFERITWFGNEAEETPDTGERELERRALAEARPGFIDAPTIDLQQREFQLSSAWRGLARAWKWVAIMLAGLLLVGGYNKAVALQELEHELASIRQQQYELLRPYLPPGTGPNANLKKALIDRLKQLQSNRAEQGFLALMLEFSRARAGFPEIEITRVTYQGNELVFDISSKQLNKIETLLEAVQKQGVEAELLSLNIKPDRSSGRLVLSGDDDV
jgi:general secretion pathway protein L